MQHREDSGRIEFGSGPAFCAGGFICCLLQCFLLLINAPAFGGDNDAEKIRLENINPALKGDSVVIAYDLIAPSAKKYEVCLIMQREGDSTFNFIPKTLGGNIGKGKFAGRGRVIHWAYKQDKPEGFQGDDYYFIIVVKKIGGSKTLLYGALSVAAVGGGGVIYRIITSQEKELPSPPSRP